jgi:hypothetical protein
MKIPELGYAALKDKHRKLRENFPQPLSVRVHRSLSWLQRAEKESNDADAKFIFLWIAFNAAYAQETDDMRFSQTALFSSFLDRLIEADSSKRIYKILWSQFAGPVRTLITNKYVFQPYWDSQRGKPGSEAWEETFRSATAAANASLANQDVSKLLGIVLSRLYVLRNQLIHGLATWSGGVNREQVQDGTSIMSHIVPIVIDLMMDDPRPIWGEAVYPVSD